MYTPTPKIESISTFVKSRSSKFITSRLNAVVVFVVVPVVVTVEVTVVEDGLIVGALRQ